MRHCFSYDFYAMVKLHNQKQVEEERVVFILQFSSIKELRTGNDEETMENC